MKIVRKVLHAALACLVCFSAVAAENESLANQIDAVNVARQGAELTVRIDLKEPVVAAPASFSVANPAKVALDFVSTANGLGKSSVNVNQGDLRSINVVQAGERTRLVLNLVKAMNYSTRVEGSAIYVTLAPIDRVTEAAGQKSVRFSEERSSNVNQHMLRDVVFRRGKGGEGRVVIDLSDSGTGIDIRQQGKALVVDFLKTAAPDHLKRKLDVTDFGTPVTAVETKSFGDSVRVTITPTGLWEHNAYQSENQFVVEVKKIIEDPNKLVQGVSTGYQGPKVSINYQNGDVRALLRLMAEELGLNAVISETVTGSTTLVLKDVPADQVIDIIFQQKGLDMRKKGNIIMIAPRDELATREKLDYESRQQIAELEPIRLEQFQINYHKAGDVAKLLMGQSVGGGGAAGGQNAAIARILSKRGSAVADGTTNMLFINDIPSKLEEVRAFIRAVDVSTRQVLIEARVVEASDNFKQTIGAKLNLINSQSVSVARGVNLVGGSITPATTNGTSVTPAVLNQSSIAGVNLPGYSGTGGTMAFSLFNNALTRILNIELAALEIDGLGKIVSSPRVITANNVKAKIEDGTEIPYWTTTTTSAGTTTTVSFKSAKLSLEATPQITPEGMVKMALTVKKEEPDYSNSVTIPAIKSSVVETSVVVENGGTVVIGGVFISDSQNAINKVPLLGDIPGLGWLFKTKTQTVSRRELLVFITPRVVSNQLRFD